MSLRLHCSFLGTPLHSYLGDINNNNFLCFNRRNRAKRAFRKGVYSEKKNDWVNQVAKLSQFLGKNAELFRKTIGARNSLEVKCVKESFARSKGLVRSLTPVWGEGLLLLRCSVFLAVISGVCLLVWYGQNRARGFVELKLLPSVSSLLSEKIQREVEFGKVRRVSPLSITLESCSIGPHSEEFSCGEVPTMKLRIRPFASLSRGKFVIDAVLTNPTVLVAQKKDFTWLGIPSSEGGLQRHISSEEGIDYRTKTRRISREEAAAQWTNNRDNAAKEAAAMGYIVSEKGSSQSEDEVMNQEKHYTELKNLKSFPCMDEKMHSADEHCVETGINYDMKHAELEKAFGIKIPGSGRRFWSKMIEGPVKHTFKWNSKSNNLSIAGVSAKRRILERSATAAFSYFQSLPQEKHGGASERYDVSNGDEYATTANQEGKKHAESLMQNRFVSDSRALSKIDLIRSPFLMTIYRLTVQKKRSENFPCDANVADATEANRFRSEGAIASHVVNERGSNIPSVSGEYGEENTSRTFTSDKCKDLPELHHSAAILPPSLKSNSPNTSENARQRISDSLFDSVEKLNPEEGPIVEDSVTELIYASDATPTESVEKAVPVMLDSVHFNGGTLVLLAYGDREPREMGNTHGHVKFQNHYGRVHVQLSGNCNIWRSGATSQDGGFLSTDVFVDTLEQSWHANLKIKNLFVPVVNRPNRIQLRFFSCDGLSRFCLSILIQPPFAAF